MAVQTTVILQQPQMVANQGLLIGPVHGHRDWTSGLCGCCQDVSGMCKACFCMDFLLCSLNSRVGECPCVHYLVPGALINLRTRTRTLGGIRGSMLDDCVAMNLCFPLAVCQMDREMNAMAL